MKRTKQLQRIINDANRYFCDNGIKDESNELFVFLTNELLKENCYRGFNIFMYKTLNDGTPYLALAGAKHRDDYDCLQIM